MIKLLRSAPVNGTKPNEMRPLTYAVRLGRPRAVEALLTVRPPSNPNHHHTPNHHHPNPITITPSTPRQAGANVPHPHDENPTLTLLHEACFLEDEAASLDIARQVHAPARAGPAPPPTNPLAPAPAAAAAPPPTLRPHTSVENPLLF